MANDPNIRDQDIAYRRGMLLGLTMAEIMVLILFTLLLALAAALSKKEAVVKEQKSQIIKMQSAEVLLRVLQKQNKDKGVKIEDVVRQIKRQKNKIDDLQAEVRRLQPAGTAVEDIVQEICRAIGSNVTAENVSSYVKKIIPEAHAYAEIAERLKKRGQGTKGSPEEIVRRLDRLGDLKKSNDNLRGQLSQLTEQIKKQGRGNAYPSCWTTIDGKTESIFKLVIGANGIKVEDRNLRDRAADKRSLPLQSVEYNRELSLNAFRREVRPLYRWSVTNQCRFYVIIYSSVQNASIDAVNAVNGFFYPDLQIQYRAKQ